jgi:hypothetical protein
MQYLYISYPEDDYEFAHRLVDDLQRAGYAVFVDAVAEAGTMPWAAETRHAIRSCGAVLMVLSPAEGRRVGTRHEGILANRRRKPVYVLRRSPGDLPRYLQRASTIDFSGEYEPALRQLVDMLPEAATLLTAPDPMPQRRPRRPPRQPNRTRRRMVWALAWGMALVIGLALLGIALGVIPV